MPTFYTNLSGIYWGVLQGEMKDGKELPIKEVPAKLLEVPFPPPDGLMKWTGSEWVVSDVQRSQAMIDIDSQAEMARSYFITSGSGQSMVYISKMIEAEKFKVEIDGGITPNPEDFPLMNGRAKRLNLTLLQVSEEWKQKSKEWLEVAAEIEDLREEAKEKIKSASLSLDIQTTMDNITWPKP